MTDDQSTIQRVTVLNGHTSPETAYVVDDYPYGRRLRCKIRYWIETGEKGSAKGKQRFVSQTTNPKVPGEVWNKPKASTYALMAVMYLDHNDHVQWWGVGLDLSPVADARARLMGIYDQLTEVDRRRYDYLLKVSQKYTTPWHEWEECIHAMTLHMHETGEDPDVSNGVWEFGGRQYYVGKDPAVYVATARQRLQQS
ncbi:hypothetical protein [Saccharopolyspora rosea]|uniref:Uncharacterized protein n=1 Tax=Saccharopolyspora rosea TaxID=524884 RepID=A0ABW3FK69_9PSEU|nr:hypothetical protein [Saccharopolyspora rosea]